MTMMMMMMMMMKATTGGTEVELAPDAILRIGGLPAKRGELKPGMEVPLEFGRDGRLVNAIEAEAAEHSVIEGELQELKADANTIYIELEDVADGQPRVKPFSITPETIIWLDFKPANLTDLKQGCGIMLRLSEDGSSVRHPSDQPGTG